MAAAKIISIHQAGHFMESKSSSTYKFHQKSNDKTLSCAKCAQMQRMAKQHEKIDLVPEIHVFSHSLEQKNDIFSGDPTNLFKNNQ